jgi:hypothetical protein
MLSASLYAAGVIARDMFKFSIFGRVKYSSVFPDAFHIRKLARLGDPVPHEIL